MANNYAPAGYSTVSPYIIAKDAAGLYDLIRGIFGAEEGQKQPGENGGLMHGELRIGDSLVMFGEANDTTRNFRAMVHVYVRDADATYRRAIEAGAASLEEPTDAPYGDRRAAFTDPAGNEWYVATARG